MSLSELDSSFLYIKKAIFDEYGAMADVRNDLIGCLQIILIDQDLINGKQLAMNIFPVFG